MSIIWHKITHNLKQGTFLKNGTVFLRNRTMKFFKTNNFFYRLDKNRVKTKQYLRDIPTIGGQHYAAGNYYLDNRLPLNQNAIIYSLGILNEISFDSFVCNKFGCKIYMYDPTPVSITFMKKHASNPLFNYHPIGVWTEKTVLKFFEPKYGGSSSVVFNSSKSSNQDRYFEAPCLTMKDLMVENKHTQIDVFKADIEGAALPILEQMLQQNILPNQIIVELERPDQGDDAIADYFNRVSKLRQQLKTNGYEEFLLPRKEAKYFGLEMLFVKIKKS